MLKPKRPTFLKMMLQFITVALPFLIPEISASRVEIKPNSQGVRGMTITDVNSDLSLSWGDSISGLIRPDGIDSLLMCIDQGSTKNAFRLLDFDRTNDIKEILGTLFNNAAKASHNQDKCAREAGNLAVPTTIPICLDALAKAKLKVLDPKDMKIKVLVDRVDYQEECKEGAAAPKNARQVSYAEKPIQVEDEAEIVNTMDGSFRNYRTF